MHVALLEARMRELPDAPRLFVLGSCVAVAGECALEPQSLHELHRVVYAEDQGGVRNQRHQQSLHLLSDLRTEFFRLRKASTTSRKKI